MTKHLMSFRLLGSSLLPRTRPNDMICIHSSVLNGNSSKDMSATRHQCTPRTPITVPIDGNRFAPGPHKSPESTPGDPQGSAPKKPTTEQHNIKICCEIWFSSQSDGKTLISPTMAMFLPRGGMIIDHRNAYKSCTGKPELHGPD